LISYFSNLIYRYTQIPDIVWLLLFGALLGPVTGIVDHTIFRGAAPVISTLSIMLITFEAGMEVRYKTLQAILPNTLKISLLTFFLIVSGTTLIGPFLHPELSLLKSMVLGTVLGGLSTVAVVSIRAQIGLDGLADAWKIMALESTIVDPIRVIIAISVIKVALAGHVDPVETFRNIYFILLMGSATGLVAGALWIVILHRLRGRGSFYMITIAVLFIVYFLAENLAGNGGGTMACFFFGFTISNLKMLSGWLGFSLRIDVKLLADMNREINFALKSYYFVYTGLIVSISMDYVLPGLGFTLMIIILRVIAGIMLEWVSDLDSLETGVIKLTYPLGTSALVFAQLPLLYDFEGVVFTNPHLFTNLVFPVVLGTILFSALAGPIYVRRKMRSE
jgi:NhaP-type Na+/H+ or K+/H+ antiporter